MSSSVKSIRKIRSRIALHNTKRGIKRSGDYMLSVYGVWLKDRWHDATYRYCVLGEYGHFYSDWLMRQEDCIFLDIGSNIGLYAILASTNPGIKVVYAFEPVPETFDFLLHNIVRNNAQKTHAYQVGISSEPAELLIKIKKGHSGVSTLRSENKPDTELAQFDSEIKIKVVGSDFLNETVDMSLARKIAIKIDVEGHEEIVLDTLMKSKIWRHVWNIYYEVNERFLDHKAVLSKLEAVGFEVVSKQGSENSYDLMVQRKLEV